MSASLSSAVAMTETVQVYVGIGSNVDREANIQGGLNALNTAFGELTVSAVYESKSFGFDGDPFYNLVAGFVTTQSVQQVAESLRVIEFDHGRKRNEEKYSSRTLDIDLLLYGSLVMEDANLVLPRPDIDKYSFVLQPLAEIAGSQTHPVSGKSFAELWQAFDGPRDDLWPADYEPEYG